jgi:hypothetical protein
MTEYRVRFYECETASEWCTDVIASDGSTHTVRYDQHSHSNEFACFDYSCDCSEYQFRKKCTHIEEMRKHHCNWQQALDNGEPLEISGAALCPKCQRATTIQLWAT